MQCAKCRTINPDSSRFCSNCGHNFYLYGNLQFNPAVPNTFPTNNDGTLKFLLLFTGWIVVNFLMWDFIIYVIEPLLKKLHGEGDDYWHSVDKLTTIFGWLSSLGNLTVGIITLIKVKGKLAKAILIAYLASALLDFSVYRIAPLFEKKNDFIYYQF